MTPQSTREAVEALLKSEREWDMPVRVRNILRAAVGLAESAKSRTYHDDDCADKIESFENNEDCECGTHGLIVALSTFEQAVKGNE